MEQQQLEELKNELAAFEGSGVSVPAGGPAPKPAAATDSVSQELKEFFVQLEEGTSPPRDLSKRPFYEKVRKRNALRATAGDENLPVADRTAAAIQWRDMLPRSSEWHQFPEAELAERLSNHPHAERLKKLAAAIEDDRLTIRERFVAIDEHKRIRDEFPKRDVPYNAFVMHLDGYPDAPGRELATEIGKVIATAFGASSTYVAGIVQANRGFEFECSVADLVEWLRQHPEMRGRF